MTGGARTRLIVALLLVFLAGLATGVFGGAWHARHAFSIRHGERMADRMREHLQQQLKLTPEQMRDVEPILNDMARQLEEIRAESGRRVSDTIARSHEQLATHLTPTQRAELKQMEQRHAAMLHRHLRGAPPPPDAP